MTHRVRRYCNGTGKSFPYACPWLGYGGICIHGDAYPGQRNRCRVIPKVGKNFKRQKWCPTRG